MTLLLRKLQGGEVAVVGSNGIIGHHNLERGNNRASPLDVVAVLEKFIIMNNQHGHIIQLYS